MPNTLVPRRGRPPKARDSALDTRELLVRAGLEVLTEKGYSAAGLDEILRRVGVPKGSFYHYFDSKDAFGLALIERYAAYFARKLDRHFDNDSLPPLARLEAFIDDATAGMARHDFKRGCLIGNLGQEMGTLPEPFRARLIAVFEDWEARLARCLKAAQAQGQLADTADCAGLATLFWTGWEGAVLRAKLEQRAQPLLTFAQFFSAALPRP
ncbi:TetR family transcriptional regulator [Comamonas serinivorans]|uniref:TetR family transcriptional regulator n=1 Tax=Comamonas serinivorans TaxID=1082851 RepID=A0A1Y0EMJ6_9BURK|nr:TetR/AcrR family transcriptional regulator [Comamonas serinivorans]ARU04640.1 TetR family transcriptional regulator [Comamonas serinivorans]